MAEIRRIVHRALSLLVAATILLAGCADQEPTQAQAQRHDEVDAGMTIEGRVFSMDLMPLAANITILETNETVNTAADGSFQILGLARAFYTVQANAPEHGPQTLTAAPEDVAQLRFILGKVTQSPSHITTHYAGKMQCGAEYGIVSGSCGRVLDYVGQEDPFSSDSIFDHGVEPGWATLVVDLVWDEESTPAIDGLRTTVKAITDDDALTSYEQYGRFFDQTSYTFRIEPDQSYDQGTGPVPGNATWFQFDIFPQGHGHHAACTPDNPLRPAECFLGAGVAMDLRFDLYVTTFYVEKAPQGFTIQ